LAIALDQGDQVGGQPGQIGQRLVHDDRLGGWLTGGGTTGRAFARHALALDEEDRLVRLAGELSVIAFDEHDTTVTPTSVVEDGAEGKNYVAPLETTHNAHGMPVCINDSTINSIEMEEGQPGPLPGPPRCNRSPGRRCSASRASGECAPP